MLPEAIQRPGDSVACVSGSAGDPLGVMEEPLKRFIAVVLGSRQMEFSLPWRDAR